MRHNLRLRGGTLSSSATQTGEGDCCLNVKHSNNTQTKRRQSANACICNTSRAAPCLRHGRGGCGLPGIRSGSCFYTAATLFPRLVSRLRPLVISGFLPPACCSPHHGRLLVACSRRAPARARLVALRWPCLRATHASHLWQSGAACERWCRCLEKFLPSSSLACCWPSGRTCQHYLKAK